MRPGFRCCGTPDVVGWRCLRACVGTGPSAACRMLAAGPFSSALAPGAGLGGTRRRPRVHGVRGRCPRTARPESSAVRPPRPRYLHTVQGRHLEGLRCLTMSAQEGRRREDYRHGFRVIPRQIAGGFPTFCLTKKPRSAPEAPGSPPSRAHSTRFDRMRQELGLNQVDITEDSGNSSRYLAENTLLYSGYLPNGLGGRAGYAPPRHTDGGVPSAPAKGGAVHPRGKRASSIPRTPSVVYPGAGDAVHPGASPRLPSGRAPVCRCRDFTCSWSR